VLILAAAVRGHQLDRQSLWFDEAWSAYAASRSSLAAALAADPTNQPLYYGLLHVHVRLAGDSEFALRYLSLLLGVLVVALCGRLACRLAGARAGRWALVAAACAPLLWWSSQEARMYSLLAVLALCAALAWHALRAPPAGHGWWVALVGAEAGLLYAHNTGPLAVAWLNVATMASWALRRGSGPAWRPWLAAQAAALALWTPWFLTRFADLAHANRLLGAGPSLDWPTAARTWGAYWAGTWSVVLHEPQYALLRPEPPYLGLPGLALLVSLPLLARRAVAWPLAHAVVLAALVVLGLMRFGLPLHGRYLVIAAPFLAAALGIALASLRRPLRLAGAALLVAVMGSAVERAQLTRHARDDARAVVRAYARDLTAADAVMAWSYADRYDLWYYWSRLDVQARRVTVPEGTPWPLLPQFVPASGRVAVNVWPTQRADQRGALPCLLGHGAREAPELWPHRDMDTLVHRQPPQLTPRVRPLAAAWDMARLAHAPAPPPDWPAHSSLCAPVRIHMLHRVGVDLKLRVEARNGLGLPVARADVLFAADDGRSTSQLRPGEAADALALLTLPAGAPGGPYAIVARLYDEAVQPWGYELRSGEASGHELSLATWRVTPSARGPEAVTAAVAQQVTGPRVDGRLLIGSSVDPAAPPTVRAGDTVQMTLAWSGPGPLPALALADDAGTWSVPMERHEGLLETATLDWLQARVPPVAAAGPASVRAQNGTHLASILVDAPPRLDRPPPSQIRLRAPFDGLGDLVGAGASPAEVRRGEVLQVELVWQAGEARDAAHRVVFVHVMDAAGRMVGQSDAVPAGGERPTTGWRPGEFIVDRHEIRVAEHAPPGPSSIVVGVVDPETGRRLALRNGADSVVLPLRIHVR